MRQISRHLLPILALALVLLPSSNTASTLLREIANNPKWHKLLHYQEDWLGRNRTQVDDPSFFLAPSGDSDPFAELTAFMSELNSHNERAIHCRFPARSAWLREQLPADQFANAPFEEKECKDFASWKKQFNANRLTLVFPSAYLNNPSSMFGHIFLRVDNVDTGNDLLDLSVNYAARTDSEDDISFAVKGLSGGYPGIFSIQPYHQKINEYSNLESRDIWEYELNLDQDEIDQFLRHLWEIKDTQFDYYFLDENCAYRLIQLLDVATSRANLTEQLPTIVTPLDTIQTLDQHNLIRQRAFRPSKQTKINHLSKALNSRSIQLVKELVTSDVQIENALEENHEKEEKIKILELAYHYARYLKATLKHDSEELNNRALALLSTLSKINTNKVLNETSTPKQPPPPENGHSPRRIALSIGNTNNTPYIDLTYSIGYHNFTDNIEGFPKHTSLEALAVGIRHNKHNTRLKELTIFDLASYTPSTRLFKDRAWTLSSGLKRPATSNQKLTFVSSYGIGSSWIKGKHLMYTLADAEGQLSKHLAKGHNLLLGSKIGWLVQSTNANVNAEYRYAYSVHQDKLSKFSFSAGIPLDQQSQIGAKLSYEETRQVESISYFTDLSLTYTRYF